MKNLYAVKIPADLAATADTVELNADFPLQSMYDLLGCDLVQPLTIGVNGTMLWCDEEALCKAEPKFNVRASILARTPIFGDVILAGDDGEKIVTLLMDCPKLFFNALQREGEKFVAENGNFTAEQVLDSMG